MLEASHAGPRPALRTTTRSAVRPAAIPSSKLVLSARLPLISAPFLRGEIVSVSSDISVVFLKVMTRQKGRATEARPESFRVIRVIRG